MYGVETQGDWGALWEGFIIETLCRRRFSILVIKIYPVVAEITMLNDCKALLRQRRRSYFMLALDFFRYDVLYGLINTLNKCT